MDSFNEGLMKFLEASPTPFHATNTMSALLNHAGFISLNEREAWDLQLGNKYYVTRNDSSIVAFTLAERFQIDDGFRFAAAHTDSPCLKLKPASLSITEDYLQFNVETYGGLLMAPWFDRDLGLAGRVYFQDKEGKLCSDLITIQKPVATIPSLAIHLDRTANDQKSINPQTDLLPILGLSSGYERNQYDFNDLLIEALRLAGHEVDNVLDHELSLFDLTKPSIIGSQGEFLAAGRLDNLLSCYTGLMALMNADPDLSCMLICNDHEEVGSQSTSGAQGDLVDKILHRVCPNVEDHARLIANSLLVSTDNAHAVHPNFVSKHDKEHRPHINKGVVIKNNANQRYASNSETQAIFKAICREYSVPFQYYSHRNDLPCGSTLGPMTAAKLGVRTIDVGVPTLAMHSPRELAGTTDAFDLYRALTGLFQTQQV